MKKLEARNREARSLGRVVQTEERRMWAGSLSTRCIILRGGWLHADGTYPGEGDMFRGGDHEDGGKTAAKDRYIRRIASNGLSSWLHTPKLIVSE